MRIHACLAASCVALWLGCSSQPPPPPPAAIADTSSAQTAGAEQAPVDGTLSSAPEPATQPSPAPLGAPEPTTSDSGGPVFVNGAQLAAPDLAELYAVLGAAPLPGRYWYDAVSGLWGLEGHGAGGVTRPSLTAAPLPPQTSAGTSAAFVNGRQLPVAELTAMATLLAWPLPVEGRYSGHYTLDGEGALNSGRGRYLGNVAAAAKREAGAVQSGATLCIWYHLHEQDGALGRDVTIACD